MGVACWHIVQMVRRRREGARARDVLACAVFVIWSQIVTNPDRIRAPCKTHLAESRYPVFDYFLGIIDILGCRVACSMDRR